MTCADSRNTSRSSRIIRRHLCALGIILDDLLVFLESARVVARLDVALTYPEVGVGSQRRVRILDQERPERCERHVVAPLCILSVGQIIGFFVAQHWRRRSPRDTL